MVTSGSNRSMGYMLENCKLCS